MNAIFQYWTIGPLFPGCVYGSECMAAYAKLVGADYVHKVREPFTDKYGVDARWFDKLRPVFDPAFDQYDKVMVVDHDVFPVDGITASIFDELLADFGMVEEIDQPALRAHPKSNTFTTANDRKWAAFVQRAYQATIPVDEQRRPRAWNAGVILFSRAGRTKLRAAVPRPKAYHVAALGAGLPGSYATEQCYLNTLAFLSGMNFTRLPRVWNEMLHHQPDGLVHDKRTAATRFVHVMFRGADHHDAAWHHAKVHEHITL